MVFVPIIYTMKVHQLGEIGWPALISKAQTHLYTAYNFTTFTQINPVFPEETAGVACSSPLMIITSSGDCFFPSATSQIGLVSCPSHLSPGCLSCREHKPVGDQLSSDPKMWPAAQEEARPSLGGSHCLMGVQGHRGCGLGGWEDISGAQPEHPR